MISKVISTFWAKIYMSGPIAVAEQVCREFCQTGLCVTIEPTRYIYTGGEESGFVIGLIDYPRFPVGKEKIFARAKELAELLISRTCQWSALIQTPETSEFISTRPEAA